MIACVIRRARFELMLFDNMGVSTMSDYDRNVTTAPFGQTMGRAGATVAVDEGLRAYILRI